MRYFVQPQLKKITVIIRDVRVPPERRKHRPRRTRELIGTAATRSSGVYLAKTDLEIPGRQVREDLCQLSGFPRREARVHRLFQISLLLKAAHSLLKIIGGILLAAVPQEAILRIATFSLSGRRDRGHHSRLPPVRFPVRRKAVRQPYPCTLQQGLRAHTSGWRDSRKPSYTKALEMR